LNSDSSNLATDSAEILARFCDLMLRKSPKQSTSEEDGEEKLANLVSLDLCNGNQVQLFRFLDNKDVFQKHYTRSMAKRMVFSLSASEDLEQNLISRFKARVLSFS
jgi:hypothetical protein